MAFPTPATKPVIIVVAGAWHSSDCYEPTAALLQSEGYEVLGCDLASYGASPALENWDPDVAAVRRMVQEQVDKGKDVVLVFHSYSGLPGSEAVKDLDKASRTKAGQQGGVVRLVYCCAFLADVGASVTSLLGDEYPSWFDVQDDYIYAQNAADIFYNDLPHSEGNLWAASLKPHSLKTFQTKVTYAAWRDVPSTVIVCENDNAIPLAAQEKLLAAAGDVALDVVRCDASHSPFLSRPWFVAATVRKAAGEMNMRHDSLTE